MRIPPGLKRSLRPLVFHTRQWRRRLRDRLLPPRAWNGEHDPALLRFEPWSGTADGTHAYDFLGVRTDPAYRRQFSADPPGPLRTRYPHPSYTYLELIFVLQSVLDARERFCMIEIGASYGPWLVVADRATRISTGLPTRLVGVEMVPQYHRWMEQHFRDNGIDPAQHLLMHSAVSDFEGAAGFDQALPCDLDYGQNVARRRSEAESATGAEGSAVACTTLPRILERVETVDLLHADAQGEEERILSLGRPQLERQVRRLFVATHSRRLHRALRRSFPATHWEPIHDFPPRSRARTRYGDIELLDGVLAWVNRRRLTDGAPAAGGRGPT